MQKKEEEKNEKPISLAVESSLAIHITTVSLL